MSGLQGGDASSAQNDQALTADSFQSVLAQVTDPAPSAQTVQSSAKDYSWANTLPQSSSNHDHSAANSHTGSDDKPTVNSKTSAQTTEHAKQKTVARAVPQSTAKEQTSSSPIKADSGAAVTSMNQAANGSSETAQTNSSTNAWVTKKNLTAGGSGQTVLPAASVNALGGLKSLAGSAFVLHVTPANGSQGGADQGNSNQPGNGNSDNSNQNNGLTSLPASPTDPAAALAAATNGGHTQSAEQIQQVSVPTLATQTNWAAPVSATSSQDASARPSVVSTAVEVSDVGGEDPAGSPQTVRTVQVQLAGEGDSRVDLRLVQHGDGLSVSVRSSDSTLTKSLQENLPELSTRLAAEKYQTHVFLPPASNSAGSSGASSDDRSGTSQDQSSGRGFSQSSSGQSDSQSNGRQNPEAQQDDASAWQRQMNALGKLSSAVSTSVFGPSTATQVNQ